jgi:hypothetical protein
MEMNERGSLLGGRTHVFYGLGLPGFFAIDRDQPVERPVLAAKPRKADLEHAHLAADSPLRRCKSCVVEIEDGSWSTRTGDRRSGYNKPAVLERRNRGSGRFLVQLLSLLVSFL